MVVIKMHEKVYMKGLKSKISESLCTQWNNIQALATKMTKKDIFDQLQN